MGHRSFRAFFMAAVAAALLVLPGCGVFLRMSPRETVLPERGVVELPTVRCANMFLVRAQINGRGPFTLLIDTGAVGVVLTPGAAARLEEWTRPAMLPAIGATGAIVPIRQRVWVEEMRVGEVEFRGLDAFVLDMTGFETVVGGELDGILGYRAFGDVLLTLDYLDGRVMLQRGEVSDPGDGSVLRIEGQHVPWITIRTQGRPRRVIIDSGSSGDFSLKKAENMGYVEAPRVVGTVLAIGGHELRHVGRAAGTVELAGHVLEEPLVEPRSAVALMGTQIMKHFRVTFDQRKRRVRFDRDSLEPLSFRSLYGIGVGTLPTEGVLRITHIFEGLPAEAAGLRVGDVIETMDGRPLLELFCERERIFDREMRAVLGVRRAGELIEVPVDVVVLVP
jgi:hypothetical protein